MLDPAGTPDPRPKSGPSTDPMVAWNKIQLYLDRLFDSLEALDESGGITAAASSGGWTPKARKRAEASLIAAREAIDRQLGQLREGRGR